MTNDTINDTQTIAGNAEGNPSAEKGTPMDKSIGDGPTMRPKNERGGRGAFAPGDVIAGRYVIERMLGEGGMGIVYQCLDKVGGVSVAVKCLPPEVSRNADEMEDIRTNYRLVADLHHPNIAGARTLELDESTGDYYLVMDLARGTSLKRWMRRNPQATTEAKLAILRQVAAALDYAHARKVIHRDVKPENVMVDDEGIVKVLDFGLAAQIRSSQSRTSAAVTSRGGTPGYKSPEQWRGKPQREQSDVYSFGVMAYWMFAGVLPFDGDDPVVLGHAVLTEPVEPIAGLPVHMNAALAKALAKQPNERFVSCGEVVDALEGKGSFSRVEHVERVDWDGGARRPAEPVGSRVPRDRTGGPQSGWPRPVAAVKGLLAVAALTVAVTGGWWHYRQKQVREQERVAAEAAEEARRQKAVAEEEKRRAEKWLAGLQNEGAQDYGGESFIKIVALHAAGTNAFSRGAYTVASAQFGEMIKVAPECKQAIEHAKKRAQEKRAKENAEKMKSEAEAAAKECERLNVETFAKQSWNEAAASLKDANNKFKYGDFPAASNAFAVTIRQFEICTNEVAAVLKAKGAVVPIRKQALKWQSQLKDISGDEDIEASNNDLANTFAQADTHFSDKERRWSDAATLFTNYVMRADKLIQLYKERQKAAVAARTKAELAENEAKNEDAEQFAKESWKGAVKRMKSANDEFEGKRFVSAANKFNSVATQFDRCANEAKNNKMVRALLGTWECSMRREGITKVMTSSVGLSIRHTHIERRTDIDTLFYTFEGNGAYKLKTEKSYTIYYPEIQLPNGDVDPAKTDHNKATLIEGGKWSLQGNMLILRTSNLKIDGETIPIEKISIDYAEQKFTVVWSGEDRVELRYADKHKERVSAAPLEGQTNTSYTYLTDGRCRMYTRTKTRINVGDFSTDCETEVNETESPRILRRR